jgi:hypothetical protein
LGAYDNRRVRAAVTIHGCVRTTAGTRVLWWQ